MRLRLSGSGTKVSLTTAGGSATPFSDNDNAANANIGALADAAASTRHSTKVKSPGFPKCVFLCREPYRYARVRKRHRCRCCEHSLLPVYLLQSVRVFL